MYTLKLFNGGINIWKKIVSLLLPTLLLSGCQGSNQVKYYEVSNKDSYVVFDNKNSGYFYCHENVSDSEYIYKITFVYEKASDGNLHLVVLDYHDEEGNQYYVDHINNQSIQYGFMAKILLDMSLLLTEEEVLMSM